MPKMKTHKAGAKRYRVTGNGKLMRGQAGRSHLNTRKASKRKRSLDAVVPVAECNYPMISIQLPYKKHSRA